ncbi:MAG: hypothetical protein JSV96_02685 [Candidatus Aminicenantes bacterium]|nr:MAG: hypothetical protein JSV96_02685 [Candidatus Aminicenantes bacterium]
MKKPFLKSLCLFFIFLLIFFLSFCGKKEKTDEDLIQERVKSIGTFAEKKDILSLMLLLTEDYVDFEGRGKVETEDMAKGYFNQYRGIAVNVLSTRIDGINLPEASVQTEVAFSSGAAKVFRKLIRVSLDNYRISAKLRKEEGQWRIQYAEWRYVTLNELFPESLSILKKIFPEL